MRKLTSDVLEIGSAVAVVVGVAMVSVAAGWIVGGLLGVALAYRVGL
jgi:hypothetical protein